MAKGDHIYRAGHIDHHGIDCGDGTVIHYSGKGGTGRIERISKTQFARGKQIKVKKYSRKYAPSEIVNRAERRLKKSHREEYNVFFNNCEHFAYDCTNGQSDSPQVDRGVAGVAGAGIVGATMATTTTQVAAGGVLGLLGVTTTVAAFPVAATVAGAGIVGAAIYKGLQFLDNQD
ncbi:MAG: lecithin retinol acyltransferase family protein [Microcoleaceae cyanobacterium]